MLFKYSGVSSARAHDSGLDISAPDAAKFSLERALTHRGLDTVSIWVDDFLRGPGRNVPLAEGLLRQKRWWAGPVEIELSHLIRVAGPGREYHEPVDRWQDRVGRISSAIRDGTILPPLIAEYQGGALRLADGNHRHAALQESGASRYWTLIWCNTERDFRDFSGRR